MKVRTSDEVGQNGTVFVDERPFPKPDTLSARHVNGVLYP